MPIRTRTRYVGSCEGSAVNYGTVSNRSYKEQYWTCTDTVGSYGVPHDLSLTKSAAQYCLVTGEYRDSNGNVRIAATRCPTTNPSSPSEGASHLTVANVPSWTEAATKTVARSNPSRAHVQLPVFIFELRDLPRLLKLEGDTLIKKIASGNLSWQFGWRPLLSDLEKMLSFTDVTEKRFQELKRLQAKGGLRRRVKVFDGSATSNDGLQYLESWFAGVRSTRTRVTQVKMWGTVVWKPTGAFPKTDADMRDYAWRCVRGFHLGQQISNLWEAIPWSWLVDWFTNVGDYLIATQNSSIHTPTRVCVMKTTTTKATWPVTYVSPGFRVEQAAQTMLTSKERKVLGAGLSASVPLLSAGQLSILGSLHVLGKLPLSRR